VVGVWVEMVMGDWGVWVGCLYGMGVYCGCVGLCGLAGWVGWFCGCGAGVKDVWVEWMDGMGVLSGCVW
jgi:hypothetical protein